MTRKISQHGMNKIKQWEGLSLKAYKDVGGIWTIGYGHTGDDVTEGKKITEAQAEVLLRSDLRWAETCVAKNVTAKLNDNQFAALVSFCYNVGESAFKKSTLLKKLNAGSYEAVPTELLKWNKVKGKTVAGLVNRRAAEIGLWSEGMDTVGSYTAAPESKPLVTKESAAIAAAAVPAIGSAAANGDGPIQWVIAGIIAVCFVAAAFWYYRNRRPNA